MITEQELHDKRNPKELPLAKALIETAAKQGATQWEFFEAMERAKREINRSNSDIAITLLNF